VPIYSVSFAINPSINRYSDIQARRAGALSSGCNTGVNKPAHPPRATTINKKSVAKEIVRWKSAVFAEAGAARLPGIYAPGCSGPAKYRLDGVPGDGTAARISGARPEIDSCRIFRGKRPQTGLRAFSFSHVFFLWCNCCVCIRIPQAVIFNALILLLFIKRS